MRAVVVSDVHEQTDELERIVEHEKAFGLDYVLDCGDRYNNILGDEPENARGWDKYDADPDLFGYVDLGVPTVFLRGNHEAEHVMEMIRSSGQPVNGITYLEAGNVETIGKCGEQLRVMGLPGVYSQAAFGDASGSAGSRERIREPKYFTPRQVEFLKRKPSMDVFLSHEASALLGLSVRGRNVGIPENRRDNRVF